MQFVKIIFRHYSNLFNLIVDSYKNGEFDFNEKQKEGKIEEIKSLIENEFKYLQNDDIMKEIKKIINEENKINLLFLTEMISIISLKMKSNAKMSDCSKAFYLFEKMGNCEESIKKILVKIGKNL